MIFILNCRSCERRGHCASATWTHRWMFDHSCSRTQTGGAQVREVTRQIIGIYYNFFPLDHFSFLPPDLYILREVWYLFRLGLYGGSKCYMLCKVFFQLVSEWQRARSRFPLCLSDCISKGLFAGGAVATFTGVNRFVFGTLPLGHTWDWLTIRDCSSWKEREPMLKVQHSPSVHQRLDNISSKLNIDR